MRKLYSPKAFRAARAIADVSQAEMARMVGVSREIVIRLEKDPHAVSIDTYVKVVEALRRSGIRLIRDGDHGGATSCEPDPDYHLPLDGLA